MSQLILGPIVGGLNSTGANLWGRCDSGGVLHAWLGQQPDLSDASIVSNSLPLRHNDGYSGVAPLQNLSPNTHYHYTLGIEETPPDPAQGPYPGFTTFPEDGQEVSFNFAFGSCFLPKDAESGEIFKQVEIHRQNDKLRFWLLIGDQIYADDYKHNGLKRIAVNVEDYRQVYHYAWFRPCVQNLLANLPVFMTMDDHDVEDDWCWTDYARLQATIPCWNRFNRWREKRPVEERRFPRQRVLDGLQAYWEHQAMHGPHFINSPKLNPSGQYDFDSSGSFAYTFNYGAAAFFVLDTRSQRIKHWWKHMMLDEEQWQALEAWLLQVKDVYPIKFIVSSGAILYRWFFDIPADRWSGFLHDRKRLLDLLATNEITGVYILTGDLHTAHAVRAELYGPQGKSIPLWEFCSTPFAQNPKFITTLLYNPFRFQPMKGLKRLFTAAANNFGLVRVNFLPNGKPNVVFEVYGEEGSLLGKAGE